MCTPSAIDRKVEELTALAGPAAEYVSDDIKRKDDWIAGHFGLMRKDGKFFKVMFVRLYDLANGQRTKKHLQPLVVQEHNQYDKHACDKVIGHIALPVRMYEVDDQKIVEVGITAKRSPGTFCEPTFTAPRCSLSSPNQLPDPKDVLWHRFVRPDPNRLTGKVGVWVLRGNQTSYKNCVWFTLEELALLADHEKMEDGPSQGLIHWVLGHADQVRKAFGC